MGLLYQHTHRLVTARLETDVAECSFCDVILTNCIKLIIRFQEPQSVHSPRPNNLFFSLFFIVCYWCVSSLY